MYICSRFACHDGKLQILEQFGANLELGQNRWSEPFKGSCLLCTSVSASWAEQCRRNNSDAILTPVCVSPGGDDGRIKRGFAELITKPVQMGNIGVVDSGCQFYFYRDDLVIVAFNNEVDLVLAVKGPQMMDFRLVDLGIHPQVQCDQRFKQGPEQRAIPRKGWLRSLASKKGRLSGSQQACGQGGVGEVVFGGLG